LAGKQFAAVLTVIGGVFYLVGSVVASVIIVFVSNLGSLSSGLGPSSGLSSIPSISSIPGASSSTALEVLAFGAVCGVVIIAGGALINSSSAGRRKGGGVLALLALLIGAIPDLGGLLIGFILALVGAVMGLTYKPNEPDIRVGMTGGYSVPAYAPLGSSLATSFSGGYCITCGKQLHKGALFCKNCGSPVPQ